MFRLYHQLTEQQAAGFGSGYDLAAGLDRYLAWLDGQVIDDHRARTTSQSAVALARPASVGRSSEFSAAPHLGKAVSAGEPAEAQGQIPGIGAGWDADRAVTELYHIHYRLLVRLAAVLVSDAATAEEIVQDSFVAVHAAWPRLADIDRALSYLRQAVVTRCRSVERHRLVVDRLASRIAALIPGSAQPQITTPERSALVSALRTLPPRQREVLMLRFYADLSEAQAASALGITISAVRSHTAWALSALRAELAETDE